MTKERKNYSPEFRIKAVELISALGSLKPVATELNVNHNTLIRWKKEYRADKLTASGVKVKSKEEQELQSLRKELNEIRLERDILKKAVSIFSKSDR
jgi:transposase